jgi:uncharacterized protein YoaH (UPF0181 family)
MRKPSMVGFLLVSLLVLQADRVESQGLGDRIKKKATDAAKGKDAKKAEPKKDEGPITSAWAAEKCGPITPEQVSDLERGLTVETKQRGEFDNMFGSLPSQAQVIACRNAEVMTPGVQKILSQGMTEGASNAALTKAMAKNSAELEAHMDKKCGKDPSKFSQRDAYNAAHAAGAKAAGLSEKCYDKLKEVALGFCKLSPEQQQAAVEQGIRAKGWGLGVWVFTSDEAKALSKHCGTLVPLIEGLEPKRG